MNTTTLDAFWTRFASTTIESVFGNINFFGMVFIVAIVIMLLGAMILTITLAFRRAVRRKRR